MRGAIGIRRTRRSRRTRRDLDPVQTHCQTRRTLSEGVPLRNPPRRTLRTPSTDPVGAVMAPSAGWGYDVKRLPPARVSNPGAFFRSPEATFVGFGLTTPNLQKSLFRTGEMAVLVLSACLAGAPNWPKNRRQKVLRLFRAPPQKTTPILSAANKKSRLFFDATFWLF